MQNLYEIYNTPKIFVSQCKKYLSQLGYDDFYDYDRFIGEELSELINNHESGKHDNNKGLLIDDIVDSIWTILAKIDLSSVKSSAFYSLYSVDEYIELIKYNCMQQDLIRVLHLLNSLSRFIDIELDKYFALLAEENMSKLSFENHVDYLSGKISLNEIFRTGKLNKKDRQGNLYNWYRPANFNI